MRQQVAGKQLIISLLKSTVLTGSSARGCWVFRELQGRRRIDCLFIRGAIKTEINLMQESECGEWGRGITTKFGTEKEREISKPRAKSTIEQIQYRKKRENDWCGMIFVNDSYQGGQDRVRRREGNWDSLLGGELSSQCNPVKIDISWYLSDQKLTVGTLSK